MRGFNYKKATQSLNFFATQEKGSINKMKAIKLVWLADRLHLRNNGRTITGDIYFALENGPVPSATRDILEQNDLSLSTDELEYSADYLGITDKYNFRTVKDIEVRVFSESDIAVLNAVY